MSIIDKINQANANVAVIGLGYVGLPIFLELLNPNKNFKVFGIDSDIRKIQSLKDYKSYIRDITDERIEAGLINPKKWILTSNYSCIKDCDVIIICVPTPLKIPYISEFQTKEPDWTCLDMAIEGIIGNFGKNPVSEKLIIIKSTVSPTTTQKRIVPQLCRGLPYEAQIKSCLFAFSPERENPADKKYNLKNTPMVVGGIREKDGVMAHKFLLHIADEVILLPDAKHAEMVKILENTFRFINISFMMEFKQICDALDIDVFEVIKGASTKPFGFMPFYPSAGIGGHCIPIDPYYLQNLCEENNIKSEFISLADKISSKQPSNVVKEIINYTNRRSECYLGDIKVLLLGMAYKPNVNDVRNSPSLSILKQLTALGFNAQYVDFYIPEVKFSIIREIEDGKCNSESYIKQSKNYTADLLQQQDIVVMLTDHDYFDMEFILEHSPVVFDTKGVLPISHRKVIRV